MRMVLAAAAAAVVSAGFVNAAHAADLFPQEAPPPVAEAPPPAVAPPVTVVPRPPAVVVVEPPCPSVWRCGYWGCGWRPVCGPVGAEIYVGPRWGYYGAYRGYRGPYWDHGHHWGYRRHWS